MAKVYRLSSSSWDRSVEVTIHANKYSAKVIGNPDTGAEVNIIPRKMLHLFNMSITDLKNADITLLSFTGMRLKPDGYFHAKITIQGSTTEAKIYVQKGATEILLAGETAEQLGIVVFPHHNSKKVAVAECQMPAQSNDSITNVQNAILKEFSDVFDDGATLRAMIGDPMRIHLQDNAVPFALTATRQVAFGLRDQLREELESMLQKGIIERVADEPSKWCHPIVVVKKPDGRIRLVVDFTKLNQYVARPTHPMKTPRDAVDGIRSTDRYFTTLDAVSGYWQVELDEASSHLTTFISPEGRYRFLRAPMGLNATGDEYNRRGDLALQGIPNVQKVVDDIMIHTPDFASHLDTLKAVLQRCRENGITLSRKKFAFAKDEVKYVGYNVGKMGISADPAKICAIKDFPTPTNITELRSFLGLVNQLTGFSKDLSGAAEPLRSLLKKGTVYAWSPDHTAAFESVKNVMSSTPILRPFDANLPTYLHTDASRTRGLGFALLQKCADGQQALIHCGSRFVTDTESRYAMIELELLAVVWAMQKCKLYLLGISKFNLIVDHRPLVPILNSKGLDEIENPRILRLKEKLMPFSFHAEWKKGKEHLIPDALSRSPVADPDDDDHELEKDLTGRMEVKVNYTAAELRDDNYTDNTRDLILEDLKEAARVDDEYQALRELVRVGFPKNTTKLPLGMQPYYRYRNDLSEHDGLILLDQRIVIPKARRGEVLRRLHLSHQGIVKTRRRAQQTVFWPGIASDVKNKVDQCSACQLHRPSLPAEEIITDQAPTRPFQEVAMDMFEYAGKHFMVYVDRFSGWIEIHKFGTLPCSERVMTVLRKMFEIYGVPNKCRSDGALMYTSTMMRQFMEKWGIIQAISAPHFPSSNGLAESAVKTAKGLVATTSTNGNIDTDEFAQGLLELRNAPRANGRSPAEMVYGAPLRALVPALQKSSPKEEERDDDDVPENARSLPPFAIGTRCWVQDPATKKWSHTGVVTKVRNRNYILQMDSGRLLWRNRRQLRKNSVLMEGDQARQSDRQVSFNDDVQVQEIESRRSERLAAKKKMKVTRCRKAA